MTVKELIFSRRSEIRRIAERHGASNVRLFGSVARGNETAHSDIDLLIDVTSRTSAWFPTGLIADLEEVLGRKVEIVTERGLNKELREKVLEEAVPL